ncbi:uncharacterized protein LOC142317661 [Lycorma delicatula]|uniref:uncharacterized protein LOC142317661 n=1 Tax=Lycorma delicatula TaxID=130591 RepID=UPI003F50F276
MRDIVATAPADPGLNNVVVRLGGFHLLISFLGSIGKIMSGSGLEELWATIYTEGSIPQMLLGKAYARAVQAHLLTNLALAKIILDSMDLDDELRNFLDDVLADPDRTHVLDTLNEESCGYFSNLFEQKLKEYEQRGPTAKLWIQYYRMTCLLKQFLEAEPTGNWTLHVTTIRKMLPFFHASGHFIYAKSTHVYLQDVALLEEKMTRMEFEKFTELGFFIIRRRKKQFSGISPDQTIEQTTMRLGKSHKGVTVPGRGITDNETSSEQHVDMRSARIKRDNEDAEKLDSWFAAHQPFPNILDIVSIGTGIVGDETTNCHLAEEEGTKMMTKKNDTFGLLTFQRRKAVKPLSIIMANQKVKDTVVPIDPMLLFHRMTITQATVADLQSYLQYELSPYPMYLFDESGMRKGTKSSFYDAFWPLASQPSFGQNCFNVFNGEFLLHKVKWKKDMSKTSVANTLRISRHCPVGKTAMIFYGFSSESDNAGTKSTERLRPPTRYTSPPIQFDIITVIQMSQENFFGKRQQ